MLRVYDEFLEDEAITSLTDRSYRLHVSALIYCSRNLTDGHLSEKAVKVLQAILDYPVRKHVSELEGAGLWVSESSGYCIKNYLEFNPDAATVKREKAKARERMRRLREKRSGSASHSTERADEHNAEHNGERALPPQSSPVQPFGLPLKAVPADDEIEREVDKLLTKIKGADEGTKGVLLSVARKLPLASVAKVRESCQTRKVGVGYAVNALKDELAELEETA